MDTKTCPKCGVTGSDDLFNRRREGWFMSYCRRCHSQIGIDRQKTPAGKQAARSAALKFKYGIDLCTWEALFDAQGRTCGLCRCSDPGSKNWHMDHCHSSGTVRSILCMRCNLLVGHVENGWQMPDRATIERYLNRDDS